MSLNLITDRTASDTSTAKSYQGRKWADLSETEKQQYLSGLKGAYSYIDFNRVENAVQYLSDLLKKYGYTNTVNTKTDWTPEDMQKNSEIQRYIDNVAELKNKYYSNIEGELPTIGTWLTVEDANYIEQLLFDINDSLKGMEQLFVKSGVSHAGQSRLWQQRFRRSKNWIALVHSLDKYNQNWNTVSTVSDEIGTIPLDERTPISVSLNTWNDKLNYIDTIVGGVKT